MAVSMNIGVIGGHKCGKKIYKTAQVVGGLIAQKGWILICGGYGGVMEAACLGAKQFGGLTVGILSGSNDKDANNYLDVRLPTGIGYARNMLIVRASTCLIAIDGKEGTLSELAFALSEKKPVLGIDTWDIPGIIKVRTPEDAIRKIQRLFPQAA